MIRPSDSANQAIEKTINELCRELSRLHADDERFPLLVDAISKLRASLNPVIHQIEK